jgi:hypothetical protein
MSGFSIEVNGVRYDVPREVESQGGTAIAKWLEGVARQAQTTKRRGKDTDGGEEGEG